MRIAKPYTLSTSYDLFLFLYNTMNSKQDKTRQQRAACMFSVWNEHSYHFIFYEVLTVLFEYVCAIRVRFKVINIFLWCILELLWGEPRKVDIRKWILRSGERLVYTPLDKPDGSIFVWFSFILWQQLYEIPPTIYKRHCTNALAWYTCTRVSTIFMDFHSLQRCLGIVWKNCTFCFIPLYARDFMYQISMSVKHIDSIQRRLALPEHPCCVRSSTHCTRPRTNSTRKDKHFYDLPEQLINYVWEPFFC